MPKDDWPACEHDHTQLIIIRADDQEVVRVDDCVRVKVKAEVGFLNDKVPVVFNRKPVYICLLAETSGGRKVYFCRIMCVSN